MLDTKLKSSNKLSFLAAGLVILAAVVGFMALYPMFYKKAARYDANILQSEDFLKEFYRANFVLYKDLQELVQEENVSFTELFLSVEENKYASSDRDGIELADKNFEEYGGRVFEALLGEWESSVRNVLTKEMYYCMCDLESGKVVSNANEDLRLLGSGQEDKTLSNAYPYYIKMTYDKAGNLISTAVKGVDADTLFMNVQGVMHTEDLRNEFWLRTDYYGYFGEGDTIYYDKNGETYEAMAEIVNGPKNVTVCYAISRVQMEALASYEWKEEMGLAGNYRWNQWYAYYTSGAVESFWVVLGLVAALALLLCYSKRYTLHLCKGVKMHLEFGLLGICIWFVLSAELVVSLLNFTRRGYWIPFYETYLQWLPKDADGIIEVVIHVVVLFALLGVWYYLITTLGEVTKIGWKRFLTERSLIAIICGKIGKTVKKGIVSLKEEILHTDLKEKKNQTLIKLLLVHFVLMAICCLMWVFGWLGLVIGSVALYIILNKALQNIKGQYDKVLTAARSLADGDLETDLQEDFGIFESYKKELADIRNGFKKAVAQEVKSQRMKTELITNVSHDLKTPLTAMITYIELLDDDNVTVEQRKEYVGVLKKKSQRLKHLIEDLFEVSKANSGNVTMNPVDVDVCNLMRQVYLEYEDKAKEAGLQFRFTLPEEKVILQLDSQKTYRVFENLYTNIIKYAMPNTRVYIGLEKKEEGVLITLKNMSATELNIAPEELTERFVRGDDSRNTEGSGLGLAIARSFVELQRGTFAVEIDGDLFKVQIEW